MAFHFRNITALALAVLVALTSVQFAAARGQSPAVGVMEICTGTGPLHILVDETGDPTGGVMICPDYAMAVFADVWTQSPELGRVKLWHAVWLPRSAVDAASILEKTAQARGPPAPV
ncbi:hypothetical protein [Marivita sp. XM-24bin2]|jgi:hypothetical protein|uniref:hypothetical protein n=1 Tax=unclassified Marivita TaxID=2632480 RepID=UPI000D79F170|nr:hypothetical protein [Marivita sp. XM-24bin2]MCR9109891.1 hypothetical protein [Paracoccaceae bacterium]PWL36417.1 MAG: hypothetical protein DCO97_04240 [Marivita sp. XM-24bin2]